MAEVPAGCGSESRNDQLASSPIPAELPLRPVEDGNAHMSPRQTSDDDDELILAPKRQPSNRARSHKGRKKTREALRSVYNNAPSESGPSSEGMEGGEEDEVPIVHFKRTSAPSTNDAGKSGSCATEAEILAPPKLDLRNSGPTREADPQKSSPTTTTGKLRYSLSRSDRKTSMRELIRRAASHTNSPFSISSSPIASPLAKTTKSALRRIAPLHPTRRTPPPPLPRPPPPKKSKKMLALEEKWEMELEEEVEGWSALTNEERQDWRRAKRDRELGVDD
ncbi:hypothetical protein F5148DRAFT_201834 [Russula earlei]|uniref:Uncharacterized protein n=1 Tax=Russula earlei TaxID=71964 RepID=A0ACC0UJR6_9AGAM|nr:hypothetical protein F5148DRAFT_201834 [Russula earlei]